MLRDDALSPPKELQILSGEMKATPFFLLQSHVIICSWGCGLRESKSKCLKNSQ